MGHLLRRKCSHSPLILCILFSAGVPFALAAVRVLGLALAHKRRITVQAIIVYSILFYSIIVYSILSSIILFHVYVLGGPLCLSDSPHSAWFICTPLFAPPVAGGGVGGWVGGLVEWQSTPVLNSHDTVPPMANTDNVISLDNIIFFFWISSTYSKTNKMYTKFCNINWSYYI